MADKILEHLYKLKGGEEAAVERANPFLERREPIVVYCTDGKTRMKIGDGIHLYNDLQWVGGTSQSSSSENEEALQVILDKLQVSLDRKVDKEFGKGLSTNDYSNADKEKLSNIEAGATRTIVDTTSLDARSDNAISNAVVTQAINNLNTTMNTKIEDKVSQNLNEALKNINLDGGEI